jgi:hypothetical protein
VQSDREPRDYPPHYPHDGTYADLLCWHMDYWGTRPKGTTRTNGAPWTPKELRQAAFGRNWEADTTRIGLDHWRGAGSAPVPQTRNLIEKTLFGTNELFALWRSELREAHRRSAGRGKNPRTVELPPNPPPPGTLRWGVTPSSVPRPTDHFIGRGYEIEAIANYLTDSDGAFPVLIQGGPGIGKSELTKAVAHHPTVELRFRECRYFVQLETAHSAVELQNAIALAIGGDPTQSLASALQLCEGRETLLVLDNLETRWESVAERGEISRLLADLAEGATTHLLCSFRGREAVAALRWSEHYLDGLPTDVATDLFASIAGPWVKEDALLEDFILALGGIPLALSLVAHRAHGRKSLAPLWREWSKLGTDLAVTPDTEHGRLTSLPYSIDLSLRSPRVTKSAIRLFAILGGSPGGLSFDDVEVLLGKDAFNAIERLCHAGLSVERENRVDLLPPIRQHARLKYPMDSDAEPWAAHFNGLLWKYDKAIRSYCDGQMNRSELSSVAEKVMFGSSTILAAFSVEHDISDDL